MTGSAKWPTRTIVDPAKKAAMYLAAAEQLLPDPTDPDLTAEYAVPFALVAIANQLRADTADNAELASALDKLSGTIADMR